MHKTSLQTSVHETSMICGRSFGAYVNMFLMFDCLGFFFVPLENFSLIWRRHHCRWTAANFDLCSVLMVIEQRGFFSVPHLLWHRAYVYNGHLRGDVHLLVFRLRSVAAGTRTPNLPLASPLRHRRGAFNRCWQINNNVKITSCEDWTIIQLINPVYFTAENVILKCLASTSFINLFANNVLVGKLWFGVYFTNRSAAILHLVVTLW